MSRRTLPVWLYGTTIFLGSFLLFQIQPMIAKMILPWFGGAANVWTACMLFFQAVLLGGYAYADFLVRKSSAKAEPWLHLLLLLAGVAVLPVIPSPSWKLQGGEQPLLSILGVLLTSVGLPYFILASTSPLLQALYSRQSQGATPYRLFALSNLASMLALLSYPTLLEPALASHTQAVLWSGLFVVYAVLTAVIVWASRTPEKKRDPVNIVRAPRGDVAAWVLLPALASLLLLATTNYLCENIAAVPFLWILPLVAYLLSFILVFDAARWYRRTVWFWFAGTGILALGALLAMPFLRFRFYLAIALIVYGVFTLSVFCHGEAARKRPEAALLTRFYLCLSLGGVLGGLLVGVFAPLLLPGNLEFPIALVLCAVLLQVLQYKKHIASDLVWAGMSVFAVAQLFAAAVILFGGAHSYRNFYGVLRVVEQELPKKPRERRLVHGVIDHGSQFLDAKYSRQATDYYAPGSGVQVAIDATRHPGQRVGIVGLGAGTLAAYARESDTYRFYELDPKDVDIAQHHFTYMSGAPAKVDIVLGDGRLSLERENPQQFDVLAVDAFNGDSIPVHLLSQEAMAVYRRHLAPRGILAIHISNWTIDLEPVIARTAKAAGLKSRIVIAPSDEKLHRLASIWTLLSTDGESLTSPAILASSRPLRDRPDLRVWTDDYSNIWQILR